MTSEPARPAPGQRIAAVVALLALAVAIVVTIAGVTSNIGLILAAIVCDAVLGLAGWYAVTRSGLIRALAAVVALGALVGFVAVVVAADIQWLRVLLALVAVAVSVVAARRALQPLRDPALSAPSPTRLPTSKRMVLLMNPKSGGGKVERFHLVDECRKRGIEPVVLMPGDDLRQLAVDAVTRGADVVGMAGGDGSQALVASVAIEHDVPMVVIPAGTRNHFALDLGLDRNDVVGALDAYRDGVEGRIDLATVNGRIFVNNASLGLYAKIVQSPAYRNAKRQTAAAVLPEFLGPNASPIDLRYTGPDGTEHTSAHLVMVSNNPYQLQTIAGLGTRQALDGGVLGILTATIESAAAWEQFLALEMAGQVRRFRGWTEWQAPQFEIRSDEGVAIGIDGEALTMDPPLVFRSLPSVLRVRRPPAALTLHADRKVRLLSRSTVADLGRVAVGHPVGADG